MTRGSTRLWIGGFAILAGAIIGCGDTVAPDCGDFDNGDPVPDAGGECFGEGELVMAIQWVESVNLDLEASTPDGDVDFLVTAGDCAHEDNELGLGTPPFSEVIRCGQPPASGDYTVRVVNRGGSAAEVTVFAETRRLVSVAAPGFPISEVVADGDTASFSFEVP